MQDHTNAPNEHMPQPVGKESSHSLKYIIGLAFFIAWTGLVGFVGYQLKVVVDYIEGPEVEDVEEVDDEVEEETSMYIDTEDGLRVEYDYEKHEVGTEFSAFLDEGENEYCYLFSEGVGNIEERIVTDTYIDVPEYEPEGGWSALNAFESPRPERANRAITHYCKLDVLGPADIVTYRTYGLELGEDTVIEDLLSVLDQEELVILEGRNLETWAVSTLETEDGTYLVYQFGDAGFAQWMVYEVAREFVNVTANLVESCSAHDSFDMAGYAVLDCEVHTGLVTEDLDSDEE